MFRVYYIVNDVRNFVYHNNRVTYILRACYNKMEKRDNSSAQVFVFTAKAVRTCKLGQRERKGR
jgi:hypothetical protein